MEKYAGPSIVGSYVELMHSGTEPKVAASTETAKRVESLTTEWATVRTTLQKKEK